MKSPLPYICTLWNVLLYNAISLYHITYKMVILHEQFFQVKDRLVCYSENKPKILWIWVHFSALLWTFCGILIKSPENLGPYSPLSELGSSALLESPLGTYLQLQTSKKLTESAPQQLSENFFCFCHYVEDYIILVQVLFYEVKLATCQVKPLTD